MRRRGWTGAVLLLLVAGCASAPPAPATAPLAGAPGVVRAVTRQPHRVWTWRHRVPAFGFQQLLAVGDDVVVGLDRDVALLGPDGTQRWSVTLDDAADWRGSPAGSGVLVGGGLDESSRHGVTALSTADGHVLWHSARQLEDVTPDGVVVRTDTGLALLALADGTTRWSTGQDTVAVDGDRIDVASGSRVSSLDPATGEPRWSRDVADEVQDLVSAHGVVLAVTSHAVTALDGSSGEVLWTRTARLGAQAGMLTPSVGWVRAVTADEEDGGPASVRLVDRSGRSAGTLGVDVPSFAGVAFRSGGASYLLDDGRLYDAHLARITSYDDPVRPADGGVYAITDRTVALLPLGPGAPLWTIRLPAGTGLPTLPVDRALYVLERDGVSRLE